MTHPNPIQDFVSRVTLAPSQAHKALTLWPLVWPEGAAPSGAGCTPLAEALAKGTVRIDELGDRASVPHVRLTNDGRQPVLFLFGEEILGAKQNRVANASFLVGAGTTAVIDVSCVEAGRWSRRTPLGFQRSGEAISSSMRQRMSRGVSRSVAAGRGFQADQAQVWDGIKQRLRSTGTSSRTSAWSDYRRSRERDVTEIERAFQPLERQVGFVAMVGEEVVGLEALGRPELFAACFRTLVRSYTIDASDASTARQEGSSRSVRFDGPEGFLAALRRAPASQAPSRGMGHDLRVDSPKVSACALACGGLVHLTAFPAQAR